MNCTVERSLTDCEIAPSTMFRIATRRREIRVALGLVYRAYLRAELALPNPFKMRVTAFHTLPTTEVLMATRGREAICTATLVRDGELGLPMDSVYAHEIESLRNRGLTLAEVSCLADRRADPLREFSVLEKLMSLIAQVADRRNVDQLLVAVHPRHARFYARYFGFEHFGGKAVYPSVRNRPAVALALDLNTLGDRFAHGYQRLFGNPFPNDVLESVPVSDLALAELRRIAQATDSAKLQRLQPHVDGSLCV